MYNQTFWILSLHQTYFKDLNTQSIIVVFTVINNNCVVLVELHQCVLYNHSCECTVRVMSIKLDELNCILSRIGKGAWVNECSGRCIRLESHGFTVTFSTFHSLSHPPFFSLLLSHSHFSIFLLCPSSVSFCLHLSRYIIDTEHIYESFRSPENRWPLLSRSVSTSFLFICLLHLYSLPQG